MVTLVSVTPILPVRDFEGALERYSRMGFDVTTYTGDALYAYADRDQVNLHLIHSTSHNPLTSYEWCTCTLTTPCTASGPRPTSAGTRIR